MIVGRPRIELNKKDFESLLAIGCTLEEVVAFFDNKLGSCSEATVERWCKREYSESFADISAKKRQLLKISIRRNQLRLSEKSAAMAIFLGKNYLGQKDNVEPVSGTESMEALTMLVNAINGNADK